MSSSPVDGQPLNGVSCTSPTSCIAVDNAGYMLSYSASGWTTYSSPIDSGNALEAVSCPTSSFCAAVDNAGRLLTSTNPTSTSGWTAAHNDGARIINAVSCTTSSFCVAVDSKGYALSWNGTAWSSTTSVTSNALEYVSCPTSTYCIAVDNEGQVLTDSASVWTSTKIDGEKTLNGVSCNPQLFFCAAVDNKGNAFTDQAPRQLVWDTNASLPLILSDGTDDYVYSPSGEPVEQIALSSSTPTFMTYITSNSSWLLTNAAGDETAFYGYDAFGTLSYGTPGSPFGYAGQYADASSGLDNMRARWFEPQTGAFTTRDPAFAQTDQAYAYASDDPVNKSDPSGLSTIPSLGGIICAQLIQEGFSCNETPSAQPETCSCPGRTSTPLPSTGSASAPVDCGQLYDDIASWAKIIETKYDELSVNPGNLEEHGLSMTYDSHLAPFFGYQAKLIQLLEEFRQHCGNDFFLPPADYYAHLATLPAPGYPGKTPDLATDWSSIASQLPDAPPVWLLAGAGTLTLGGILALALEAAA